MFSARVLGFILVTWSIGVQTADSRQAAQSVTSPSNEIVARLIEQLRAQDARLKELETQVAALKSAQPSSPPENAASISPELSAARANPSTPSAQSPAPPAQSEEETSPQGLPEHTMQLPGGGPVLKIRGFADFNLGFGSDANPLIFPLPTPVHNTFQIGEFDLFLSSRLSKQVSFLSEIVIGSDPTNSWGLDIERMQISYKPSRYFEISGGRYHTSIGYYNTTFHHGTWFQTATGRPFMYFFEDSGGILPVHSVGVTATGLVPRTETLGLHWLAEMGNGRSSMPNGQPVQNFFADKNHKNFNLAVYVKPQSIAGLQAGASYYRDRLVPPGIPHVDQTVGSLYAVFINSDWEFLNEAVLLHNKVDGARKSFNSPLLYTQLSKKFHAYRPYFRYQYLNISANDPVSIFTGRYQGPSFGLRMDFTNYAALKTQYNRLYLRGASPENGVDAQVAFTF